MPHYSATFTMMALRDISSSKSIGGDTSYELSGRHREEGPKGMENVIIVSYVCLII